MGSPNASNIRYGKIASFIIFVGYLTILPSMLKIIWPYILNLPGADNQLIFYLICSLGAVTITFWTYNLIMCYIYTAKIPFFQQYRDDDKPWPWEVDSKMWRVTLKDTLKNVLFNLYFVLPLFILISQKCLPTPIFQKSLQKWPSSLTILLQVSFFLFMEDFTFYWSHRLIFHHPRFYWIHKKHHEYSNSISLSAPYAHPIQFFFGNALETGIGYHILGKYTQVHFVTIVIWFIFRLVETAQIHSGYNWSWRQLSFLPLKAGPEHHHFHHSLNTGNLGSFFYIWDTIARTNKEYLSVKSKDKFN